MAKLEHTHTIKKTRNIMKLVIFCAVCSACIVFVEFITWTKSCSGPDECWKTECGPVRNQCEYACIRMFRCLATLIARCDVNQLTTAAARLCTCDWAVIPGADLSVLNKFKG